MLTCVQIIASLAPEGGGPSYTVPALSDAIAAQDAQVTIRTLASARSSIPGGCRCETHRRSPTIFGRLLGASPTLHEALRADAREGAILHTNGLWLMPNIYPAHIKKRLGANVRVVHSPHGMLGSAALKISGWKKRPFWWLLQRSALEAADCLHATAMSEYEEIRAAGLRNPVAVIPNGIDLPNLNPLPARIDSARTVLSLGRIHPKKGLDRLIRAWAMIESDFVDWSLRIVGPPEVNHDQELRTLALELGAQRIAVENPVYGSAKLKVYRSADLFVLPTFNENFAISVAEALAAQVPVISTKGAPWAGLETERCGWWIDHGVEPLAAALRRAMTVAPEERRAMGARGRAWMARDFGWDRIAKDMVEVYQWLNAGGSPPPAVRLD